MRSRPKIFSLLSLALFGIIIGFPAQIIALYEHGFTEAREIVNKIAPLNWLIMGLSLGNIYLLQRASNFLLLTFPTLIAAVAWNNWVVVRVGTDYGVSLGVAATLAMVALGTLLLTPDAMYVMIQPDKRWWLIPKRKQITTGVLIKTKFGRTIQTKTHDLSKTGAFVSLDRAGNELAFTGLHQSFLKPGDQINILMNMGQSDSLLCRAKVVRKTSASGNYPIGMGIEFKDMGQKQKMRLDYFLAHAPVTI